MDIRLAPFRVISVLVWGGAILVVLHVISWIPVLAGWNDHPIRQINLAYEHNLPTLFATFLLGLCAVLSWMIAYAERKQGGCGVGWLSLALAFLLLCVDESIMIHEKIGSVLHARLQITGVFKYAWVLPYMVLPYMVLMLIFVAALFTFYLGLPRDTRLWISVAAGLYVTGGMGIEMIEGYWVSAYGRDAVFHLLCTVEEVLELAGCLVFTYAFCYMSTATCRTFRYVLQVANAGSVAVSRSLPLYIPGPTQGPGGVKGRIDQCVGP